MIHSRDNTISDVSIIIPAYNESKGIKKTLTDLLRILNDVKCEIIVVDDGSSDGTGKIALAHGVKVVRHAHNKGYGASIKTGIRESKYETIVITDADGTYPNDQIIEILQEMKNFDMVVGARIGKHVKIPIIRKPAKWLINSLANYLSECKIPDLNSGLRVFRKQDVLKFMGILPDGFSFTSTITLAMLTNNMNVKYFPIDYYKRKGKSKIRPIHDTLNFIQLIIRTVLYFNPLKVFVPISLMLLLFGFAILIYSAFFLERILDTTVVILMVTALQLLAIGMIADLIVKNATFKK